MTSAEEGALGRSATSTSATLQQLALRRQKNTPPYTHKCVCVSMWIQLKLRNIKFAALAALQSKELLTMSPHICMYSFIFIWKTFHATVLPPKERKIIMKFITLIVISHAGVLIFFFK